MGIQSKKTNPISLSEADIINYWQFYGLKHDPFSLDMEDLNYFSILRWEEHLDLLQFLCRYNNVLLAITGNSGCGKTTLIKQFRKQITESMRICETNSKCFTSSEQLIEIIANKFQLKNNPKFSITEQLDAHLSLLQESSKTCLLIIDDAHLLAAPILRHLLYLIRQQSENQMKLHILLIGEPHLQNNLARVTQDEGGDEFIHNLPISPLTLEETESYLQHRLSLAGFSEMPLVQTVINRIYKLSGGAPGRINRIARRTLLNELSKRQPEEKPHIIKKYKSVFLGGFLALILLAGVSSIINNFKLNKLELPKIENLKALFSLNVKQLKDSSLPVTRISAPVIVKALPAPVAPQVASNNAVANIAPISQQKPVLAPVVAVITSTADSLKQPIEPMIAAVPTKIVAPQADVQQTAAVPEKPLAAPDLASAEIKPIELPQTAAVTKVEELKNSDQALLKVDSSNYALQLIGLSTEIAAKRFIAKNGLAEQASYYHILRNGKDWYVIIYGSYKSLSAAKAALANLPQAVKDLKPWVRGYAAIHAAIEAAE